MEQQAGRYSSGHFALALIGGALAGAAVALLVAPNSGRETRRQLAGHLDNARARASRVPEALRNAGLAMREALAQEPLVIRKEE